jgi:hypothetical protein
LYRFGYISHLLNMLFQKTRLFKNTYGSSRRQDTATMALNWQTKGRRNRLHCYWLYDRQ